MAGNNSIQILRGSQTYDPSQVNLLDGQPFYSKKNKQLYVGDSSREEVTPVGATNLQPGSGKSSVQQIMDFVNDGGKTVLGAIASGDGAVAFGGQRYDKAGKPVEDEPITEASGKQAFAFGGGTLAAGAWSFAGNKDTKALQRSDFAIGGGTVAGRTFREYLIEIAYIDNKEVIATINSVADDAQLETDYPSAFEAYNKQHHYAFAAGENSIAKGIASAAFGRATTARGLYSFAIGDTCTASGLSSWAGGYNTTASGQYSHAEGLGTKAVKDYQHVSGTYNIGLNTTLFEIGNGTGDGTLRSNAFEVYENGRAKVYGTPTEDYDVVRKVELDTKVAISDINQYFFSSLYC